MELKEPKNKNYCATVVQITTLVPLANCDNVQSAVIFNNQVIVGKDTQVGDIGLFFPVETALSPIFLGMNNLYREPTLNENNTKKGYFEAHGRIKCVKFRGHKSEGFFVPLDYLFSAFPELPTEFKVGDEFDEYEGYLVCFKYVPKRNHVSLENARDRRRARRQRPEDAIVDGQFRMHIDTYNLRKNIHRINADDIISITDKWHGTSGIVGNLLVKRKLNWFNRLLSFVGVPVQKTKYDIVHSSRRVVKGVGTTEKSGVHFYGDNIWGVVAKEIADRIPKGYTLYFEIVGYVGEKPIQKGYTYQCEINTHKVLVYRITVTNEDGKVLELDYPQRIAFCAKYGFEHVKHIYYGYAYGIDGSATYNINTFQEDFLELLEAKCMSRKCEYNPGMPAEGIVVRREGLIDECDLFKLKSFEFLSKESLELDSGEIDMETAEGEPVEDAIGVS